MSTFKRTVADNVASLKAWHVDHHHARCWSECVHEPCRVLDPEFRGAWQ